MPSESCRRRLGSLSRLCDVFRALINSLVVDSALALWALFRFRGNLNFCVHGTLSPKRREREVGKRGRWERRGSEGSQEALDTDQAEVQAGQLRCHTARAAAANLMTHLGVPFVSEWRYGPVFTLNAHPRWWPRRTVISV